MKDSDKEYILDRIAALQSEIAWLRAEVIKLKEHIVVEEEELTY